MAFLNRVQIMGNLGADPEMRYTTTGQAVTSFRVAVNRRYVVEGQQRDETEWFAVVAWNKLAETCNQFLAKGRKVYVEGRLKTRSWENKEGQKQYRTEIIASGVLFLDRTPLAEHDDEDESKADPYGGL